MLKRIAEGKRIGRTLLLILLCFASLLMVRQQGVWAEEEGNLIYVAYDDSGSMLKSNGQMVDRWCQAKYALEVFSTMMLDHDQMKVFPLNRPEQFFEVSGELSAEERLRTISGYQVIYGANTPFQTVEGAYQELAARESGKQKWLLVLTDGTFTDGYEAERVNQRFREYAESGVKVIYLRILDLPDGQTLDQSQMIYEEPEIGLYSYTAEKSGDILSSLIRISNIIFKRQALSEYQMLAVEDGKLIVALDAPVEQLIVFAQGEEIAIGNLTGEGTDLSAESSIQISRPEIVMNDTLANAGIPLEQVKTADNLGCIVASYRDTVIPKGTYAFALSQTNVDINNLEVYCKLAVDVKAELEQNGTIVENGSWMAADEYQVKVSLLDPTTRETLNSVLLDPVSYHYRMLNVTKSGEENETTASGQLFSGAAKEGTLTVSGHVQVRDVSYEISPLQVTVEPWLNPIEISCEVPEGGFNAECLNDGQQWISVSVTQEGVPLDEESWENLELTVIEDTELDFRIEKGDAVSSWKIFPGFTDSLDAEKLKAYSITVSAVLNKNNQRQEAQKPVSFSLYMDVPVLAVDVVEVPEYRLDQMPEETETGQPIVARLQLDGRTLTPEEWANTIVDATLTGREDLRAGLVRKDEASTGEVLVYIYGDVKNPHMVFRNLSLTVEIKGTYSHMGMFEVTDSAQVELIIQKPGRAFMFRYWGIVILTILGILVLLILLIGYLPVFKGSRRLGWNQIRFAFDRNGEPVRGIDESHRRNEAGFTPAFMKATIVKRSLLLPYQKICWKLKLPKGITLKLKTIDSGSYEAVNITSYERNIHVDGRTVNRNEKYMIRINCVPTILQIGTYYSQDTAHIGELDYYEIWLARKKSK